MIYCKGSNPDLIEIKVWMDAGNDHGAPHRFDIVELAARPGIGTVHCNVLADVGLPVLQPRRVEFNSLSWLDDFFRHRPVDRDREETLGIALAMAVFCTLTGMSAARPGFGRQPVNALGDDIARYENFINRMTASEPPSGPTCPDHVVIPADIAEVAVGQRILSERSGRLFPDPAFGLNFRAGDSALAAARSLPKTVEGQDYRYPRGFAELDLSAAEVSLESIEVPSAAAVSFYGDTRSCHHEKRLQSARAYPLFAEFMTQFDGCRNAIDAAEPLQPVIASLTGLSKGNLRRLAKRRTPLPSGRVFAFGAEVRGQDPLGIDRIRRYSVGNELTLSQLLDLVSGANPNWLPGDEESWIRFIDLVSACVLPLSHRYRVPARQFLAAAKGNWAKFHEQLANAYAIDSGEFDRRQISMATSDVLEAIDDFSQTVLLPCCLATISEFGGALPFPSSSELDEAKRLSFLLLAGNSGNSVGTLIECARRWMTRIPALIAAEGTPAEDRTALDWEHAASWPRLAEEFTASNGLAVQNLASEADLLEESRRLSHCVGRLYLRKAQRGKCHIFSVRDAGTGTSISTFEVAPPTSEIEPLVRSQITVVQHKARRNRRPDGRASLALTEWLEAIQSDHLPIFLKETLEWQEAVRRSAGSEAAGDGREWRSPEAAWSAVLGRNWHQAEVRRTVWNEWRSHILRGELARLEDPASILGNSQCRGLLASLSPETAVQLGRDAAAGTGSSLD